MKKTIILLLAISIYSLSINAQCTTSSLYSFGPTCGSVSNGGIAVTTTGAFGTVTYTLNPGNISNTNGNFPNLSVGTYTITGVDSFLCSSSTVITLATAPPVNITGITHTYCDYWPLSSTNTTVSAVGGSGVYTLNIVPNVYSTGTEAMLSANTNYTITAVDANGCTASTVYFHNPPAYTPLTNTITSNNSSCILVNGTGAFCATASGGFPPYTYTSVALNQTNTSGCFSNLNNGNYSNIIVTDANGCEYWDSTSINISNVNPSIYSFQSSQPSNCMSSDGIICINGVANATAPYEYKLNVGSYQTTNCFNNLANGIYTITVKDANNCTGTETVTMQSFPINAFTTYSDPACGMSNGQICATASLGTAPYTYSLNSGPGQISNCFNSLNTGVYTITVTDANNCAQTVTQILSNPNFLNNPTSTQQTCSALGSIQATVNSTATAPVTYVLLPLNISNTTGTFNNLIAGNYTIQATDATNCVSFKNTWVYQNTLFPANPSVTSSLTSLTITAPTGMVPPIQYRADGSAWQNSNTFSINPCGGYYYCQVQDANGCISGTSHSVIAPSVLPGYSINANLTSPDCGLTNGSIDIITSPANAAITYCPSTTNCNNTNSLFTNLPGGNYSYYVSDGIGCAKVTYTLPAASNCGSINGNVFYDVNNSCAREPGEINLANMKMVLAPGGDVTYTNNYGNYYYGNKPFGAYILFQNPGNYFAANSCGNYYPFTFLPAYTNYTQNFADTLFNTAQDALPIISRMTNYTPGFNTTLTLIPYRANPYVAFSGQVSLTLDNDLVYIGSNTTPASVVGNVYTWNFVNSSPITIQTNTPASTLLNTPIQNCAVTNLTSSVDANSLNDNYCENVVVVGSYDPNNKLVIPEGTGPNHNIAKEDSILTYTINFQNIGTAPARRVILIDSLTEKLEIFKYKTIYASHDYKLEVIDNKVLKVTFDDINLPDSTSNEPESHGQFVFQIHQKGNNNYGNVIRNKAEIYFDYNAPIITNQTFNTIYKAPTSVSDYFNNNLEFSLRPVPAKDNITINFSKVTNGLAIISDISGKQLITKELKNSRNEVIDVSTLAGGFYFIRIQGENESGVRKFIVR
jgi:hypothetical protein